ncbi:MAG: YcxB family protein [Polaromonas sp.]|nr:YcxB family protein [Polaromonas sp.]
MSSIKASFTLTEADFARFEKVFVKRLRARNQLSSWPFGLRVLAWMCIGYTGSAFARIMSRHPEVSGALGTVALVLVVALFILIALPHVAQTSLRKQMLLPNGAFLAPQTFYFSAASVHLSSASGVAEVPWAAVIARDEDDANHYLFIDAAQALIFPRSAMAPFASEFEQYTAHLKGTT